MKLKELLGKKIKRLRKSRGFTQEQLAEMIDIAPRNLSRYLHIFRQYQNQQRATRKSL